MNFTIRMLVVEDSEAEQAIWRNAIDMHNVQAEEIGFGISPEFVKTLSDAVDAIAKYDYDAAVVDMRLERSNGNGPNSDGNMVVEKLLESELAVIAVFTGEQAQVNTPEWAKPLVRTFRKGADEGEGTHAVMEWLVSHAPMVQSIRRAQLTIKKEMVHLFTKSIWPRWNQWTRDENGEDEYLQLALSRHLASHVHAVLLDGAKQRAHPEEWYFIPPIRTGIRTGDLTKSADGQYEIVITPRCDLAVKDKTVTILLARCNDVSEEWTKRCDKIRTCRAEHDAEDDVAKKEPLAKKVGDSEEALRRYTQHAGGKANVHFLPRMRLVDGTSLGPLMVKFDSIRTVSANSIDELKRVEAERFASLTSEFLPSLVERLGGFFSRIGTPDYSHNE